MLFWTPPIFIVWTVIKTSSFTFHRRKSVILVWNNIRVSNNNKIFFYMNYPFECVLNWNCLNFSPFIKKFKQNKQKNIGSFSNDKLSEQVVSDWTLKLSELFELDLPRFSHQKSGHTFTVTDHDTDQNNKDSINARNAHFVIYPNKSMPHENNCNYYSDDVMTTSISSWFNRLDSN